MQPRSLGQIIEIRAATQADSSALAEIYNPYVIETAVTFEETAVEASEMATRVADADAAGLPFLLAAVGGAPAGFAYASKWKGRCAYRHTAEPLFTSNTTAGDAVSARRYTHSCLNGCSMPAHTPR